MSNEPARCTHRFGDLAYDARTGELYKHGSRVRLTPQLASLLEDLLEHRGELVTRNALRERIWPSDTYVDFEHGLTAAVNRLREVLGDSAHSPRFVETIPRRGYRWVAEVAVLSGATVPTGGAASPSVVHEEVSDPASGAPPQRGRRARLWILALLVGAAAAAGGYAVSQAVLRYGAARPVGGRSAIPADARDLYMRARHHQWAGTEADLQKSVSYLQQALRVAPAYPEAYAALASLRLRRGWRGFQAPAVAFPAAREAALAALQLDERQVEARVVLARVELLFDWDWVRAGAEFGRALRLDPNHREALAGYAELLLYSGRPDEAVATLKRAAGLDPISTSHPLAIASTYVQAGRYAEAIDSLTPLLGAAPRPFHVRAMLATAYAGAGRCPEALAQSERVSAQLPDNPDDQVTLFVLGWSYAKCNRRDEARAVIRACQALAGRRWVDPIGLAALMGAVGDIELGIAEVKRGVEERSPSAIALAIDPMLDPLRGDPRFQALVDRVGPPAPPSGR